VAKRTAGGRWHRSSHSAQTYTSGENDSRLVQSGIRQATDVPRMCLLKPWGLPFSMIRLVGNFSACEEDLATVPTRHRNLHEFDPRGFGLRVAKWVEPKLRFAERGNG